MSIRPTDLKDQAYIPVGPDISESEIKKKELKKYYLFLILFVAIDFIITTFVILHESNIFSDGEKNYIFLSINLACFTIFILFIIISLNLYRLCLSKIVKYLYISLISIYFFYILILKLIFFVNDFDDVAIIDIVIFFLFLSSIIPKVFFFHYIGVFINILIEKYECQRGEEHDEFKDNIANKMDRGDNTNWSKTSLPSEVRRTSN